MSKRSDNDERTKQKKDDDYLIHHGIKGQRWGVRRYQNADGSLTPAGKKRQESTRPSKTQRDARKLADTATKYYKASNHYNSLVDLNTSINAKDVKAVNKAKRDVNRLVNKLNKKYASVSAIPEFQKDGYVVKSVEATIAKLDKQGRLDTIAKSSNPVETYNYRFNGENNRKDYIRKQKAIDNEYKTKMKNAKTQQDREMLELERSEKEDELDFLNV